MQAKAPQDSTATTAAVTTGLGSGHTNISNDGGRNGCGKTTATIATVAALLTSAAIDEAFL